VHAESSLVFYSGALAVKRTLSITVGLVLLLAAATARAGTPPGSIIDNQATATYVSSSNTVTSTVSNRVQVVTQAAATVTIAKTASKASANDGDLIAFTLNTANSGNSDAAGGSILIDGLPALRVVVSDVVPNNTTFAGIVSAGASTPLFHLAGTPSLNYVSTPPALLSNVDSVAFAQNSLPAGATAVFSFRVTVNSNASGIIHNVAQVLFNNGFDLSVPSNAVDIPVTGPAPAIDYFFDSSFARTIRATPMGSPLFVQVNAAACNLDPTVAESKAITLKSKLTGDTESFTAVETGPNTGIFRILPSVPTRDARVNAVVSGNQIMEVLRNDQITATLSGCGNASVAATILIDPAGVVFDSKSNAAVAGAVVTLIDVTGAGNGGRPGAPATVLQFDGITPAPSTVTTAADGAFQFPQVAPSTYQLSVKPPATFSFPSVVPPGGLPPGRTIDPAASYGGTFNVAAAGGPAIFDVPVDASSNTVVFVQKTAGRSSVELGDFIDYTVEVKNLLAAPLPNVQVIDTLPPGFIYQSRSVRLNAVPINDPPGKGPVLRFDIGTLPASADVRLTYRVLVGPGAAIGDNVNRATAGSGATQSNVSSAHVQVRGGVFSDKGFIVGKVFQDCNANRIQDEGELGIPNVRIYLEDGTFVVTDGQGKFSIYGVSSRTHILKVDAYSLPPGAELSPISNRNGGDGGSRFIDLKFGEMQKADFAIANCSPALTREIQSRRAKVGGASTEVSQAVKAQFTPETIERDAAQVKAMAASGFVNAAAAPQPAAAPVPEQRPSIGGPSAPLNTGAAAQPATAPEASLPTAEALIEAMNNDLAFVKLSDNDVLPFAQTNIQVKGQAGNNFKLKVNGDEASARQVGLKTVVANKRLEIWEFIGINLHPGKNILEVTQSDPWGNDRGTQKITVIAPSKLGKLAIDTGKKIYAADGKTPVKVNVRLTDSSNVPVTVRTALTLESTNGTWMVKDLNPKEPGTQVFIEGGQAEFELMPPIQPGESILRVSSGGVNSEVKIEFVPELRPLLAAGIVEYQLNFGKQARSVVQPAVGDGFEQELRLFSASSSNGSFNSAGHAALLLKGKIKGDNLITLAYDSEKNTRDRLFRDIQPDQFYPVYGDSSLRGYDAQSTSKAYLRIDHGSAYIVYGDFLTSESGGSNSLGNYNRSMTGVKEHIGTNRASVTGFASYDNLKQVVEELLANGTSGPFTLANANGIENSEKVEILVRDRHQPSVILDIRPLARFADYEFEPLTGRLLFKAPIPTLDASLNPLSIRVTYEVNQGGERFWVGGGSAQVKPTGFLQLGGTLVDDTNPQDPNKLFSGNATVKLPGKTTISGELAGTEHLATGTGLGYRVEVQTDAERLKGKAFMGRTETNFDNPSSILNKGRGETGVKASLSVIQGLRLLGEFVRTEDLSTGGRRTGGELAVQKSFTGNIQAVVGFRHSDETSMPASSSTLGVTPNTVNAVVARLSAQVPHFSRATATAEYEQDVLQVDKRIVAVGGNYQFWDKGRVYFRQELISSLGDSYSLNTLQHRNTTQIGVDSAYFKDAHVFSEYRIHDALNGRDAEAAIGLRNNWHLAEGITANTGIESIRTLNGTALNSLALTGALEYTAAENWKASLRTEWRGSTTSDSILTTVGFAARLSDSLTFLGRNVFAQTVTKGAVDDTHLQDRLQAGLALRDSARNRWNALSMFEFRDETGNSLTAPIQRRIGVFATTANYQVTAPFTLSARYAARWNLFGDSGLSSSSLVQMAAGRATYELNRHWDIGAVASTLYGNSLGAARYGLGAETGYLVMRNTWVSVGYNLFGFRDPVLTGEDITRRGFFIRLRFKFDENIFSPKHEARQ